MTTTKTAMDQHQRVMARWSPTLQVRPFRSDDYAPVARIICSTALRGKPVSMFFEDEQILLALFLDYYATREPESCFVGTVDGRVVGFGLGCKDTRAYNRWLLRQAPQLLGSVALRMATARYRRGTTYATLWWALTRAWREFPEPPLDRYPGHMHVGIDPWLHQRRGLTWYAAIIDLTDAVLSAMRARGIPGCHGHVAQSDGEDMIIRRGREVFGFQILESRPFTLWKHVTGRRWFARLIATDLTKPPAVLKRARRTHRSTPRS